MTQSPRSEGVINFTLNFCLILANKLVKAATQHTDLVD